MSHSHKQCVACHKPFTSGDDVVICPSCGAPYHRECYQKEGHCIFEDKHASGYEYKQPPAPGTQSATEDPAAAEKARQAYYGPQGAGHANGTTAGTYAQQGIRCPNCNTINEYRNIFCDSCGFPLHTEGGDPAQKGAAPGEGFGQAGPDPSMFGGAFPGAAWNPLDMSGEIDGIPKKEWASFIGKNATSYLYRMEQLNGRGGFSFMVSAFFLGPFYFAYRKMWGWAAFALFATILLAVPTFLLVSVDLGTPIFPTLSSGTLDILLNAASVLSLGVNLLFGFMALPAYKKLGKKKISQLKERFAGDPNYQFAISTAGGTSTAGIVIVVAIFFVLYSLLYAYFGDALLQYASSFLSI